jgi:subtilisin family serine protease
VNRLNAVFDRTRRGHQPGAWDHWIASPGHALTLLLGVALAFTGPRVKAEDRRIEVFVTLEGMPTVDLALGQVPGPGASRAGGAPEFGNLREAIQARQAAVVRAIEDRGGQVTGRFHRLANAVRALIPESTAATIRVLPGVREVVRAPHYQPLTETSVPFIGAPQVWNLPANPATGAGIRVGVIDTGIDYTHADFGGPGTTQAYQSNDPLRIEPGTFPTAKVVGGFDFVGQNYNSDNASTSVPQPDPDPLDCAANGHGTHVAGIVAGLGVGTNGLTWTGSYEVLSAPDAFALGPGVAPGALLYALKIFGCAGSTSALLDALEWASDPNQDEDFSDRLDVVNLSLGSPFGIDGAGTLDTAAVDRLVGLGCVVAVAAGNNGNTHYILGAPAAAGRCIAVANSIDEGNTTTGIRVLAPEPVAGPYTALEASFTPPLNGFEPIEAEIVYARPEGACSALGNPGSLAGRIALIDRGDCLFVDKVQRAQDAGAVGVIMVNNVGGPPITMGGTPLSMVTIPAVMISLDDGARLKAHLDEHPVARLAAGILVSHPEFADQLDAGSSRGPALLDSRLKPDLAAPGFAIRSAKAGSGNATVLQTGTSMSAPHVAGAAALLRQLHPGWEPTEIKAALMNTTLPTRNAAGKPYPESRTGAGRIQLAQAARTPTTAVADDDPARVAISLGTIEVTGPTSIMRLIRLHNLGKVPMAYTLAVSNTVAQNGFTVVLSPENVTVPPGESIRVAIEFQMTPMAFDRTGDPTTESAVGGLPRQRLFEASGAIWFLNPEVPLHVPYHAALRAASAFDCGLTDLALPGVAEGTRVDLFPAGFSAHPQPLVSVFELGATSDPATGLGPASRPADLLAVGAASDAPSRAKTSDATLYFAIATAANWATPIGFAGRFEVEIDTDRDGVADFTLVSSSAGNSGAGNLYAASSANDVFMPVLRRASDGRQTTNGFSNVFPANVRDTATFDNSVVVLPVPLHSLDLGAGVTKIQYRVTTYGPYQFSAPLVDSTDWIPFDAGAPRLDTTRSGLDHTPFFPDGNPVGVVLGPTPVTLPGADPDPGPAVLLLHHFNRAGHRFEIVRLHSDAADIVPLVLLPPALDNAGRVVLRWTSQSGRQYRVLRASNLTSDPGDSVAEAITATPPYNTCQDPLLPGATRFYRIVEH